MSISTSTVKRAPRNLRYTPETMELFLRAEELAEDVGKTGPQLWKGKSRAQPLTLIRHCIMHILRDEFFWNFTEIGRVFGRQYCTVIYACRRMRELIDINDPQVMRYINRLTIHNGTNTQAQETERLSCSCKRSQRT